MWNYPALQDLYLKQLVDISFFVDFLCTKEWGAGIYKGLVPNVLGLDPQQKSSQI